MPCCVKYAGSTAQGIWKTARKRRQFVETYVFSLLDYLLYLKSLTSAVKEGAELPDTNACPISSSVHQTITKKSCLFYSSSPPTASQTAKTPRQSGQDVQ